MKNDAKLSIQIPEIIESYCWTLPEKSTRYVTSKELLIAHKFKALPYWTEEDAVRYFRSQEDRIAKSTINVRGRRLSAFFNFCIRKRTLDSNPVVSKTLPKVRDLTVPKTLTSKECDLLFKKIPKHTWMGHRDRLALALMLINGHRVSTVANINWDDLEHRSDGWVLRTSAKGGVIRHSKLRPDVVHLFNQFHLKTFGRSLEK